MSALPSSTTSAFEQAKDTEARLRPAPPAGVLLGRQLGSVSPSALRSSIPSTFGNKEAQAALRRAVSGGGTHQRGGSAATASPRRATA
jgi:hypothetical protein